MATTSSLSTVSDDNLLARLTTFLGNSRELLASVLDVLIEVERRRIHLLHSFPSMFAFCTQRLGFSEGEAFRRIAAARLMRRFPAIRPWIASGRVHLTTLTRVRKHITADNIETLLTEVAGKTRGHVDMVLARLDPRPDIRTSVRRLPSALAPAPIQGVAAERPAQSTTDAESEVEQLSEYRFRIAFTASTELKEKLDWAKDLMAHSNPSRDVPTIVDRALDLLIAKLERDKFGKVERPRPSGPVTDPGAVNRATKREVVARDGLRCAFIGKNGERCTARACLEFHHDEERAFNGSG
jgi:hypothetical protein